MNDCDVPIYIVSRDRLTDLAALVDWLERAGYGNIILLDNGSTYPPLVAWLAATEHRWWSFPGNPGSHALWEIGAPNTYFVVTDPDVLPTEDCPPDVVGHLRRLLNAHPRVPKAGLGLLTSDLPGDHPVHQWEGDYTRADRWLGDCWDAPVDTTFALYRPGAQFSYHAVRSAAPYLARHMPWYREDGPLSAEDEYYLAHARGGLCGSSWVDRLRSS